MTELYDRIAKMLRLAENEGATEHERDVAMAKAQDIAFKYNIDLQDVSLDDNDGKEVIQTDPVAMETWEGQLLDVIARVNFCRTFYFKSYKGSKRRWVVFGKDHNIDATMTLFAYLKDQLVAEATRGLAVRDKRMQYARMVLVEVARDLVPTQYMQRVLNDNDDAMSDAPFFGPDRKIINIDHHKIIEAASDYLMGNDHLLKGHMGLKYIMDRTGLTPSYASEIRPYLRRGEYAPEIVKDLGVWRSSFYAAATWRIAQRLREHFNSLVDDAGAPGTALVKAEDAGLKEYEDSLGLGKGDSSARKWDPKGGVAGAEAGDRVNIHNRETLNAPSNLLGSGS